MKKLMEAKDTVSRIRCHCELYQQSCCCPCTDCNYARTVNKAKEEQAGISFKAGPSENTEYNVTCLDTINDFIKRLNIEHRILESVSSPVGTKRDGEA